MPDGADGGLLFIGDPHLASRAPGFRTDEYPRTVVEKLRWALDYARGQRLMPVLLGDLFDFPGDNATLSILVAAGRVKLLDCDHLWIGPMNGATVVLGGSCWGQKLPSSFDR